MTIGTGVPFTIVFARIDGEEGGIVVSESGGFPAGIGGMACGAVGRKSRRLVRWVYCRCIIALVATVALG